MNSVKEKVLCVCMYVSIMFLKGRRRGVLIGMLHLIVGRNKTKGLLHLDRLCRG